MIFVTTILFHNDFWPSVPESLPDCPWECQLIFDPARLAEADLVVFHIPTLRGSIQIEKHPGQKWVAWSMESDVNCPYLKDPAFTRQFDLTMTYRRDADVWTPYLGSGTAAKLLLPPQAKTEEALAVYIASNPFDRSGRNDYAWALMQHLKVDSYGRCLQNRTLEHDEGGKTKMQTMARYRFTLAFENSISQDYVTEKFFDPLIAGSVPIYLGAPNIADFAPGDHCFINVADFPGPAQLAEYLRFLGDCPEEYESYLAWKSRDLRESFLKMVELTVTHPLCRLASLHGRA